MAFFFPEIIDSGNLPQPCCAKEELNLQRARTIPNILPRQPNRFRLGNEIIARLHSKPTQILLSSTPEAREPSNLHNKSTMIGISQSKPSLLSLGYAKIIGLGFTSHNPQHELQGWQPFFKDTCGLCLEAHFEVRLSKNALLPWVLGSHLMLGHTLLMHKLKQGSHHKIKTNFYLSFYIFLIV